MTDQPDEVRSAQPAGPCDVAIIGMACIFPKAPNVQAYWQNIVSKVDAVSDPPPGWLQDGAFDPDSHGNDQIYCKRGGYLGDLSEFSPLEYGVMPVAVDGGEPEHFLALRVAHEAMQDAGYMDHPFNRERTAVILGRGTFLNRGNVTALQHGHVVNQTLTILKELHPEYSDTELQAIKRKLKETLPPFNAETAPSLVSNVMCGRIANRLGLMGPNYAVDAACASSLIAVDLGIRELLSRQCDMALVGGVSVSIPPIVHMVFCQLNALSHRSQIRPFAKDADGILMGEGLGMVVLKRRQDAERDGDRIYAVIKGVGTASDGRGKSVLTPRVEGEELALRRAYEAAGVSPETVELIEAHGTGTPVGDATEIQALRRVFGTGNGNTPRCALGSVKSMIGHTIPAAGVAGLIKTALALYHKVLPPTLHCEEPNPKLELETTPFYINTETRPWIHEDQKTPRRAGVNAFGFGGINAHVILEEAPQCDGHPAVSLQQQWDSEVCVLSAESRQALIESAERLRSYLASDPKVTLKDVAYTVNTQLDGRPWRLAMVVATLKELQDKLTHALSRLKDPKCLQIKDMSGIFFFEEPLGRSGRLAFLFPGEGAQYPNMLADLCLHFPEVRESFEVLDQALVDRESGDLPSQFIFPPTGVGARAAHMAERNRLWEMAGAVQSVTTACQALLALFERLDVSPHAVMGHSTGEFVAMIASGAIQIENREHLIHHIRRLTDIGTQLHSEGCVAKGVLVTVGAASQATISSVIEQSEGPLYLAMDNCPNQVVLCGTEATAARAIELLRSKGAISTVLPFERAYHTPLFAPAGELLRRFYYDVAKVVSPRVTMYSCTTTRTYPKDPEDVRRLAVEQWASSVRFRETVETMYQDGVRLFLEVGPRGNLTAFVTDILRGRPHLAVAANVPHRSGITQLNYCLGLLAAHGVPMRLDHLYARRRPNRLSLEPGQRESIQAGPEAKVMPIPLNLPVMHVTAIPNEVRGATPHAPSVTKMEVPETPVSPGPSSRHALVMQEYMQTMERFLRTQQDIMTAFLKGTCRVSPSHGPLPSITPVGGVTVQSATPLADQRPSVSQTLVPESGAAVREHALPAPSEERLLSAAALTDADALQSMLLDLVSEKTGYPKDVLSLTSNLEADLGIDSIKRVEILGTFRRRTGAIRDEDMEIVSGLKTLQQVLEFVTRTKEPAAGGAPPEAFRSSSAGATAGAPGPSIALPFVGTVTELTPGKEVMVRRTMDMKEDVFLHDHTIGGRVSLTDPDLVALPVVPLAVSVEMMAETASLLCPGKLLVGMKDVRGFRWVALDEERVTLDIRAVLKVSGPAGDEIEVQLFEASDLPASEIRASGPVIRGTMVFGKTYPAAPVGESAVLKADSPSRYRPEQYYQEVMFHGPRFQTIMKIEGWEVQGMEATVRILPKEGLFHSVAAPVFLLDPQLLDAAGQMVGFWTAEYLQSAFVVFPIGFESLQIYSPVPATADHMKAQSRSVLLEGGRIKSEIRFMDPAGRPWIRIEGWYDKRFDFPRTLVQAVLLPQDRSMSFPWRVSLATDPSAAVMCFRLDGLPEAEFEMPGSIWPRVWARLICGARERAIWKTLRGPAKRKKEWLTGRWVAKDAVRFYLKERYGLRLCPADIEIIPDEHGRPVVQGAWTREVKAVPCVSISHTEGTAVAIVGEGVEGRGLGIDVERLGRGHEGLAEGAFTEAERALLDGMPGDAQEEWLVRIFCAKEAVGKAIGRGMEGGPRSLVAHDLNREDGTVMVRVVGELARLCPEWSAGTIAARTVRDGDYVVAVSLCSRSQEQIK